VLDEEDNEQILTKKNDSDSTDDTSVKFSFFDYIGTYIKKSSSIRGIKVKGADNIIYIVPHGEYCFDDLTETEGVGFTKKPREKFMSVGWLSNMTKMNVN
jgi:hypothetical protein